MKEQTCALCNRKKEHAELIFKARGKIANIICKKCVKTCNLLLKQHEKEKMAGGRDWKKLKEDFAPKKISSLVKQHITGQEQLVHRLGLIGYKFCKRVFGPNKGDETKSPITMLVIGPTGSGKSYSCKSLARELRDKLGLPFVNVSCATMSSTGYVGASPQEAIKQLGIANQEIHGKNSKMPLRGIIIFDEVDKIARNPAASGQDISGFGVQRELLTLLDGMKLEEQLSPSESSFVFRDRQQEKPKIDTNNILFMFTGAFADLDYFRYNNNRLADFGKTELLLPQSAKQINKNSGIIDALSKYGMLPELLGRMLTIHELQKLTDQDYIEIIDKRILEKMKKEFVDEKINLEWDANVVQMLVNMAQARGTGVRGANTVVNELLANANYELFGKPRKEPVTLKISTCPEKYLKTEILP
jgi:ATP-dependent Clp protease ATP-binding subunit ClpX